MEDTTPQVYAGIIDEIGRRQYSGNVTWLREYIQNAIDGGSPSIEIRIHGNDFEILDHGKGMDKDSLIKQAFSIGKSFKGKEEIGELGIGMYAGSGICDTLAVRTKMAGKNTYIATVDMKEYRQIIEKTPNTTFFEMMGKIFKVEEDNDNSQGESFTHIKFEGLGRDTITLIEGLNLNKFLEHTVNVPIDENFRHKNQLKKFLGNISKEISITIENNGAKTQVTKFGSTSIALTDTFWSKDIVDDNGNTIGKLWAVYNKSGTSLDDAGILVKRKGLTVGDEHVVESRLQAKYSPRFYGEIILLDDRIEINTSRDWFIASPYLSTFVEKTKELLNELFGIADFDSQIGIGAINLAKKNIRLEKRVATNEKKKNIGLAIEEKDKIQKNSDKITEKIERAQRFKEKMEKGEININDPTNKMKKELVDRTLNSPEVMSFLKRWPSPKQPGSGKKRRWSPWPAIVITILKKNIIDSNLATRIGNGDVKDTTDRAFTFIEQKFKQMLGKKVRQQVNWKALLSEFKQKYNPPDLNGFPLNEYMEAFSGILNGTHAILRNPSNHTFMDDMNNPRNLMEIILIADFVVQWLDTWIKK